MANRYCEYFEVDEAYFPQINNSTIKADPDFWKGTYPHETFINMLTQMERILSRQEKRSLWIEGAYGTGKSQCAYALKKILDVPEKELREYWNRCDALKKRADLLEKLLGHKQKGIITAHRYASGSIDSPKNFFFAVQESVKAALIEKDLYVGENTLKESVASWIDKPVNKRYFNELLSQPEYSSRFAQSSVEEVLGSLRKDKEVKVLMDNLFRLADEVGITALDIDANKLLAWLTDVIDKNDVKIVLIWDEFSDYFKNNCTSLSEFQKIVELVNLKPFYFVPVTHESEHLIVNRDKTWERVLDRFISVEISLPDNIAFELIGHALKVKDVAKKKWSDIAGVLNGRLHDSRRAVMREAKIPESQTDTIKNIMPIHPMAALLLKNIAAAFQSNQRSMFDFVKTQGDEKVKAFQWFIENSSPEDDHPLLTVDMLWDFFYERGREHLAPDIRLILDAFSQQENLREDEKVVLKAILIMQAISQRLGGTVDLFKATEQHLSYIFEGITLLEGSRCVGIAKSLQERGILTSRPLGNGKRAFEVAVLAGDQTKIAEYKKTIYRNSTTLKLVEEGDLASVLSLPPALRLRFETEPGTGKITPVTAENFGKTINVLINILREKPVEWHFHAVIAFAKDEAEAVGFRSTIKKTVADKLYGNIVFIDALSTPLGPEAFGEYVEHAAMAKYHSGSNNITSKESADRAKRVLDQDWKNRIYNGQFIVYRYGCQEGEKLGKGEDVGSVLQTSVTRLFPFTQYFDFAKKITENQMKLTQGKASAESGILRKTKGVLLGIEKHLFPEEVWCAKEYWKTHPTLPISKIKLEVDKLIGEAFDENGKISIDDIYDFLEGRYGFAPCNLSAFLAGFLLREYGRDPFRYSDEQGGHEPMTPERLAEMLGNYIGKSSRKLKATYVVKMTPKERAFYELTEKVWKITPNSCTSVGQAAVAVIAKMNNLGLPVWCLAEVDERGVYHVVQRYIELVQKEGKEAHNKALEIGESAIGNPALLEDLVALLTAGKCQEGMRRFLASFEEGRIPTLAQEIGAAENVLPDIHALFSVKHSCLWNQETGEEEIRKLLTEYGVVKESNILLNAFAHSRKEVFKKWRERLQFLHISCEALRGQFPSLGKVFDTFQKMYEKSEVLPEQLKVFLATLKAQEEELRNVLDKESDLFQEVYAPYLSGLSELDIGNLKSKLPSGMFVLPRTECNVKVKEAAENFRKDQLRTRLLNFWKEKTGTKNPRDWSYRYKTPILCCVSEEEYLPAKKAFDVLNGSGARDAEIKEALEFLESTGLFEVLMDEKKRDASFENNFVGEYRSLLQDLDRVRDELEHLSVDTYEWYENPSVKNKVKKLAEAEYDAGGSDKALRKIDQMDDGELKVYLKRLVKENMIVGIEIIMGGSD